MVWASCCADCHSDGNCSFQDDDRVEDCEDCPEDEKDE
jgi:hypothetical protein